MFTHRVVQTSVLEIAYLESGLPDGPAVILLHGWPSDIHDWDGVTPLLAAAGYRVLVPWLRGFGPTRFLNPQTMRSGQQAALGQDLKDFMDATGVSQAFLIGYDWGGRAACIVSALWPDRVRGLVTINGYNIQNIRNCAEPENAAQEQRYWYQWYFHTERGRAGLENNRRDIARLLWRTWSPNWVFDEHTFDTSAPSFDNPDFVDVTIQSYRHRHASAAGDPAYDEIERRLATQPVIRVPTVLLHGQCDGVTPPSQSAQAARYFCDHYQRKVIPVVGHFLSREAPDEVIHALTSLAQH